MFLSFIVNVYRKGDVLLYLSWHLIAYKNNLE